MRKSWVLVVAVLAVTCASAQSVVSVRSGLIHYVEGRVLLDDKAVEPKFGQFPEVKENGVLRTEDGRAEVLLSPGVFLRVSENSSVRMIANKLADTRLELLAGSILLECAEWNEDNAITLVYGGATISPRKNGLYRIDTDPARLRIYQGQALVVGAGQTLTVGSSRETLLGGALVASKFDAKAGDAFYRWSSRRASYVAMANVSAAKSLRDSGNSWYTGGWHWNPFFGMITYIPFRGVCNSPFGYSFWSPREVYVVFVPRPAQAMSAFSSPGYRSDLGYRTASSRSYEGFSSSAGVSSGAPAAAAAPASPRTSEAASPRTSEGGGRGR